MVRLLAQLGANVETPNNEGVTPAFIATENDFPETVAALHELGATVDLDYMLFIATGSHPDMQKDEEKVRQLVAQGVDVNARGGEQGCTVLLEAAAHGDEEMIRLLVSLGGDIRKTNAIGGTPVFCE